MDATPTAQTQDPAMLAKLAALFGSKGASQPGMQTGQPSAMPSSAPATISSGTAADTSKDSASPAAGLPNGQSGEGLDQAASSAAGKGGLMEALQNLMKFLQAKPASASNDNLYQKRLEEAGIPAGETGVGQ